ncbi:hypothetical protein H9639_04100 [Arthrobacter sp. Sa2CUA1]|uniref:Uncharacterized protein n=1 Tax=Arthrobacter gallicola TaxID=2762225 RepID=A0ABR8UPN1_9MICC|nr:hypothetical protein [Arthrobacter gallicola]MBD7994473.1 hypothetical protein [Arthrobacter gallicola]
MGKRLYTEVAAARHMSSGTRDPELQSAVAAPVATPSTGSGLSYRQKRTIAWLISVLVFLTVPTLIVLLVLFG